MGLHEISPDQTSDCPLHKLKEGKQLCHDYGDVLKQYVEPVIEQLWTSVGLGRAYGDIPIPFIKKFQKRK